MNVVIVKSCYLMESVINVQIIQKHKDLIKKAKEKLAAQTFVKIMNFFSKMANVVNVRNIQNLKPMGKHVGLTFVLRNKNYFQVGNAVIVANIRNHKIMVKNVLLIVADLLKCFKKMAPVNSVSATRELKVLVERSVDLILALPDKSSYLTENAVIVQNFQNHHKTENNVQRINVMQVLFYWKRVNA